MTESFYFLDVEIYAQLKKFQEHKKSLTPEHRIIRNNQQ